MKSDSEKSPLIKVVLYRTSDLLFAADYQDISMMNVETSKFRLVSTIYRSLTHTFTKNLCSAVVSCF